MTKYEHLLYDVDDEKICWITLNRPEKLNAINSKICSELCHALEYADSDKSVNVVVIKGAGRGFCSGHDLTEDADDNFDGYYDYRAHYIRQQHEWTAAWRITKPVIASVHYCAIGKGFELALFCDITIVTEETKLGYNEIRYGIAPMNFVLPWLTNLKVVKQLVLTGEEVSAHRGRELGLVNEVVKDQAELEVETLRMARLVARVPTEMQQVHKPYLNRIYEMQGLKTATDYYQDLMSVFGACPVPESVKFTETTLEKGLRAALDEAQLPFAGLDKPL